MKMKKIALACGLVMMGGLSAAQAELSANIALTTDYVWRGISQTDEDPAIQGGVDYEHESGLSAGIWASNVDFGDDPAVDDADVEVDIYGGYGWSVGELGLSVGAIYYAYPGESDLDFWEANVGASYGPVSGMISHDPDNDNTYYEAGADFELPVAGGVGLGLHVGYYDFDGGDEYTDWKVALSKDVAGFGVELAYTDTDIDDCDECDARGILTVSKSF